MLQHARHFQTLLLTRTPDSNISDLVQCTVGLFASEETKAMQPQVFHTNGGFLPLWGWLQQCSHCSHIVEAEPDTKNS
jgi:hypothetical protein